MTNVDINKLKNSIEEYRMSGKSCSQGTLMGIAESFDVDLTPNELCSLASGFSGGIGRTFSDGTCGALSGAIIALGLILSDNPKNMEISAELFNLFKDKYGAVECGKLTNGGNDTSICVECCVFMGEKLAELIDK